MQSVHVLNIKKSIQGNGDKYDKMERFSRSWLRECFTHLLLQLTRSYNNDVLRDYRKGVGGGGVGWGGGGDAAREKGEVVYIHLLHLSLSSTCINAQYIGIKNESKKGGWSMGRERWGGRGGGAKRERKRELENTQGE